MRAIVAALFAVALVPDRSEAQPGRGREGWQPRMAVTAAVYGVDVGYAGSGSPPFRYDYAGLAFGAVLSQPGLRAGAAFGPESDTAIDTIRTRYTEYFVQTYGRFPILPREGEARTRLYAPVGLSATFRRATRTNPARPGFSDDLEVTTIGLAAGLGVGRDLGRGATAQLRAMPLVGLATQSIGNSMGPAYGADAAAEVTFGPVAGRFGISAGYDLRYARWRLRSGFRAAEAPRSVFDYAVLQHGFRIGVAF